jgi:hypothetical protein
LSRPPASRSSTESERTARPRDLFWPWFAANVSVFGISYAAFVLGFGISFWQAIIVTIIGVVVSFALCGIIAIAGKRGSAPTMILSRAAFGVPGRRSPASSRGWSRSAGRPSWRSWPCSRPRRSSSGSAGAAGRDQDRRRRRRGRDDRAGVGRRLPHHHADAVDAHLDHRRVTILYVA